MPSFRSVRAAGLLWIAWLAPSTDAQQFVDSASKVPQGAPGNQGYSENVDFADVDLDVDLDGDFDAAFAEGGDFGNVRNVLWINQAGAQGGALGVFEDGTAARFPSINDTSRDIEFADVDCDGDPDLFVTNTSALVNQTSRFWINQGPAPATAGYFVDESATRWVGLGAPGSSVWPVLLLPGGGFMNWAHDGDFADLDNDGDLDLVHSAKGGAYNGQIPTRIYLNDGTGHFAEFNPSGFQLTSTIISDGQPGLWCQGTHVDDTTDTTGVQCDIALTVVDLELGDVDGDLDVDLLLGSRNELPRLYRNLLEEDGALGFRDVSYASFTPNWAFGGAAFEQELGDIDDDGDLDLYGLNWAGFSDATFTNDGTGSFGDMTTIAGTLADAEEADFIDYDNDGDLDVYVANFSGQDGLFRNDLSGTEFTFVDVTSELPGTTLVTKDADVWDVDQDGDYDVFTAHSSNGANQFVENTSTADDVHAPRLLRLEELPDGPANEPRVVRVQVYDNAPYYVTYRNETLLEYSVDGGPVQTVPMQSSGGQIFRAELPLGLVGSIVYEAVSRDAYGNEGRSGPLAFEGCDAVTYCTAKTSAQGCRPAITLAGCVSATDLASAGIGAMDLPNGKNGILFYGFGATAVPWLGGTLCVQPPLKRTQAQGSGGNPPPTNDCSGTFDFDMNDWIQTGADVLLVPGVTVHAQYQCRDPEDVFGVVTSNALQFTIEP